LSPPNFSDLIAAPREGRSLTALWAESHKYRHPQNWHRILQEVRRAAQIGNHHIGAADQENS
jgi:hypothetical protein